MGAWAGLAAGGGAPPIWKDGAREGGGRAASSSATSPFVHRVATRETWWHHGRVPFVVQHYISLAGGGTLFDPDPTVTQPGEFALDGAAAPLPVTTVRRGQAQADVVIVDNAGVPQPAGVATFDVLIAKRTVSSIAAAAGPGIQQYEWNSGGTSTGTAPGKEVVQTQFQGPQLVTVVVTGGSNVPGAGRLAVRVWVEQ